MWQGLDYFVHSKQAFFLKNADKHEFQGIAFILLFFFFFMDFFDERINRCAYIFRSNEDRCVSKYIFLSVYKYCGI